MFEAYVTNLGLYPERGAGAGEYLKFPTTVEEVQALFSRIGIDEKQYEEYFITDYDSDILGLTDHLGEYESLDELNYLAHLLEEMTPAELEKLEAVMDAGEYTNSVKDLINLTQNLDCFDFYSDVNSEEELGRMYIQDFEAIQVPEHLIDYIDYEAYGRDIRINDGGHFAPGGYVADNRSNFVEHYTGWTIFQTSTVFPKSTPGTRRRKPILFWRQSSSLRRPHLLLTGRRRGLPMRNGRPRANLARGSPFRAMFRGVRFLIHSEERRQYAGICRRTDNRYIRESGQALG